MTSLLLQLRLRARLTLCLAAVAGLMTMASGVGIWRLQQLGNAAAQLGGAAAERAMLARELHGIVEISAFRAEALLASDDKALAARVDADRKRTSKRSAELRKRLESLIDDERSAGLMKDIDSAGDRFREVRTALVKRDAAGEKVTAAELESQLRPAAGAYVEAVDALARHEADLVAAQRDQAVASARTGQGLLLAGVLAGMLASAALGWALTASILKPLNHASRLARRVAAGDLTPEPDAPRGRDEVIGVVDELQAMQGTLSQLVREVQVASDSIATASREVATGNTDLSQRTEQTASNLQETASAMEQLTGTVQHSAQAAAQANALAGTACQVAEQGGAVVGDVVNTMQSISDSSRKIADIIGVIDGIAFQTNILALNAAVEAARAGEQGRGFAVVAGEVRSLAQRSAEAAKEIKQLIGDSVQSVESGARLVQGAGSTMAEIVESVRRVNGIVAEISHASGEQSTGIGEIGRAVSELDHMTQQNAALVEQSAAAAQSLQDQAQRLAGVAARFRVAA
ncbi:MAG: methyl-accepting chemotaxis protein [Aquincola tertiaricarbonis]